MGRYEQTDLARYSFEFYKLTYDDITEKDIIKLNLYIARNLLHDNPIGTVSPSSIIMRNNKKDLKFCKKTGKFLEGYLYCDSHYFSRRESISFHKNGFIGFAGWACENSLRPFVDAFNDWVEWMTMTKQQEQQQKKKTV